MNGTIVERLSAWCLGRPELPPRVLIDVRPLEPTVTEMAGTRADVDAFDAYFGPRVQLLADVMAHFVTEILPHPQCTDLLGAAHGRAHAEYQGYRREVWPANQAIGPLQRQFGLVVWLTSLEWSVLVARAQADPPVPSRPAANFAFVRDTLGAAGRPGANLLVTRHAPRPVLADDDPDHYATRTVPALDESTLEEWDTMVTAFLHRVAAEGVPCERVRDAMAYWDALWMALPGILRCAGAGAATTTTATVSADAIQRQLAAWGYVDDAAPDTNQAHDLLTEPEDARFDQVLGTLPSPLPYICNGQRVRALTLLLAESRYYVHTARLYALYTFSCAPPSSSPQFPPPRSSCRSLPSTSEVAVEASQALAAFVERRAEEAFRLTQWNLQDVLWCHTPSVSLLAGEPERHVLIAIDNARRRLAQIPDRRDDERPALVDEGPTGDRVLYDLRQDVYGRVCGMYTTRGVFRCVLREWWQGDAPRYDGLAVLLIAVLVDDELSRIGVVDESTWLIRSPNVYLDELRQGVNQGNMEPPDVAVKKKIVYKATPVLPPATPAALLLEENVGLLRLYGQHFVVWRATAAATTTTTMHCTSLALAVVLWWALVHPERVPPELRQVIHHIGHGDAVPTGVARNSNPPTRLY